jgi:hypothetical protein
MQGGDAEPFCQVAECHTPGEVGSGSNEVHWASAGPGMDRCTANHAGGPRTPARSSAVAADTAC